jgi:sugar diacid utilization regulator
MPKDLQSIVDSLGQRLSRAVLIDDVHLRLLAYNSHFGDADAVRVAAIMHRKAPAESIDWVNRHGIRAAKRPVRVPANSAIGMDARVCAPIRFRGDLLGYVWLIDGDQTLTEQDLEIAQAAADSAAEVLRVERLLDEIQRGRERELLRDLLSNQSAVRSHAADELIEENLIVPSRAAVGIVAQFDATAGNVTNTMRLGLRAALEQVRSSLTPLHALHLVRPDHGLLVLVTEDPALRVGGVDHVAHQLLTRTTTRLADEQRVILGVGDPVPISEIAVSYEQARQAIRVAELIPSFRPIALWKTLGIYRALIQFPFERNATVLHPGLLGFIQEHQADGLVGTLEVFLDLGCNARRSAAALKLHRTTLYYRLEKIEEVLDIDLEDGSDRLALHLGLKLARLAGLLAADTENKTSPRT